MMTCLPDELLLYVLSFLSQRDLGRCAVVCQHFHRVATDSSLCEHAFLTPVTLIMIGWSVDGAALVILVNCIKSVAWNNSTVLVYQLISRPK